MTDARDAAEQHYAARVGRQRRAGLDADQASDVVAEGTIRALTTEALPDIPTAAWLMAIDDNVRRDQHRREGRERAARGALAVAEIMAEEARLPAKATRVDEDTVDAPREAGDRVRYLPPMEPLHGRVPGQKEAYDEDHLLDGLDPEVARLVSLRMAGCTWAEIARKVGVRKSTVMATVKSAVRELAGPRRSSTSTQGEDPRGRR